MKNYSQTVKLEGELEKPVYPEIELQPTLDSFRAWGIFNELVPEISENTGEEIDTAILYGSNVNGLSVFPDSDLQHESDIDIFLSVESGDIAESRKQIGEYMDSEANYEPVINIDVQETNEFNKKLEEVTLLKYEDLGEHKLPKASNYEYSLNSLERLRAFGDGFIAHNGSKGSTYHRIKDALDYITYENGCIRDELEEAYNNNRKERTEGFLDG